MTPHFRSQVVKEIPLLLRLILRNLTGPWYFPLFLKNLREISGEEKVTHTGLGLPPVFPLPILLILILFPHVSGWIVWSTLLTVSRSEKEPFSTRLNRIRLKDLLFLSLISSMIHSCWLFNESSNLLTLLLMLFIVPFSISRLDWKIFSSFFNLDNLASRISLILSRRSLFPSRTLD